MPEDKELKYVSLKDDLKRLTRKLFSVGSEINLSADDVEDDIEDIVDEEKIEL